MHQKPDKLMVASIQEWLLLASTRHARPQWRVPVSWWSWLWSFLLGGVALYGSLAVLPMGLNLSVFAPSPHTALLSLLMSLVLGLWLGAVALLATAHLRQRRRQAAVTALNEESWQTMTQVVSALGGYVTPQDAVRGVWYMARQRAPRNTWSLQAALGQSGFVEVDYLATGQERRLRVAAQGAPGQTRHQREVVIPAQEVNAQTPVFLAEHLGSFLLTSVPEALPEALRQAAPWRMERRRAHSQPEPGDIEAPLRSLHPRPLRNNERRRFLHILLGWYSYHAVLGLAGLAALASVGLSALQPPALGEVWGVVFMAAVWMALFSLIWWAARPARPTRRMVHSGAASFWLRGQLLRVQDQGQVDLDEPFALHLSRAPALEGAQAGLLIVEVSQRGPDQGAPRRLRLCTPVQPDGAWETLPELIADAPMVDTETFARDLWPQLRYAAALHGVDPGWSMEPARWPLDAAQQEESQQEVAQVSLSRGR